MNTNMKQLGSISLLLSVALCSLANAGDYQIGDEYKNDFQPIRTFKPQTSDCVADLVTKVLRNHNLQADRPSVNASENQKTWRHPIDGEMVRLKDQDISAEKNKVRHFDFQGTYLAYYKDANSLTQSVRTIYTGNIEVSYNNEHNSKGVHTSTVCSLSNVVQIPFRVYGSENGKPKSIFKIILTAENSDNKGDSGHALPVNFAH